MHTHIIINEDLDLHLVIRTNIEDINISEILDKLILKELTHA